MANFIPFVETLAEMQNTTFVQALNHAKNTSEDALPKDSEVKEAGTSRCVHFGYPTNLHEAFQSELHKTKLLKKVLSDKDKLTNKRLTYTRELEHRLSKEQRQTQILRKRYENERTHSYFLSQTLSKAHEGVLSLQTQTAGSELLKDALREELHKRTATTKSLEEQNRQLMAILTQATFRVLQDLEDPVHNIKSKNSYIFSANTPKVKSSQQSLENSNIEYISESAKMPNSHVNIDAIRYTVPSHHDIDTLQNTAEPRLQWYGIKLAKQQSWQEQRVFANHQRVRFLSSNSTDNSTADDDTSAVNDGDEDEDEEVITNPKPSWQFSDLAKQVSKLEQECFANGFAKVKVNAQALEEIGDEKTEWRFVDLARHWERLEQRAFAGSFRVR
ncbi:hypothetical protein KCU98_g6202, partial [Aureobasidium melanogenum]